MPRPLVLLILAVVSVPLMASVEITSERTLTLPTFDRATGAPLIASNGSGYLVVWSGSVSTFLMPLDDLGRPVRDRAVPINDMANARALDIASDGSNYLVITGTPAGISVTVVEASTNVIATNEVASLDAASAAVVVGHAAWNGK